MARRRYISTKISLDKVVNALAVQHGDFAALLYTWMIPHADDDATITGDPEELLMEVAPGRRDKTARDIAAALQGMADLGLIIWDRKQNLIQFPLESFYEYQSYVPFNKRRVAPISESAPPPQITEDQRRTAEIPVSPSPSPSPSPKRSTTTTAQAEKADKPPDPMSPTKLAWRTWHEQRFASLPPARWAAEIDEKIDKGMSHELVIAALDEAIQARADHPVSWANQRLGTWFAQGIRSPDELEAAQAKPGNGKPKGGKSSGKPVEERTERDWLEGYEGHFK